jgi:hypothetical protein
MFLCHTPLCPCNPNAPVLFGRIQAKRLPRCTITLKLKVSQFITFFFFFFLNNYIKNQILGLHLYKLSLYVGYTFFKYETGELQSPRFDL